MSAEKIDHAEEARRSSAGGDFAETQDGRSIAWNLHALTHATLALVEQQRIANLIAVAVAQHANGSAMFNPDAVRAEIREGLGLG